MAYESHLNTTEEPESNVKAIAFKAKQISEEIDSDEANDDENISMLARRLNNLIKKGKKFKNFSKSNKFDA